MMGHPTAWRQRRWAGYGREKGDRATTGWMVVSFTDVGNRFTGGEQREGGKFC